MTGSVTLKLYVYFFLDLFIGIDDYGETVAVNSGTLEIYAWDSTYLIHNVSRTVFINDPAVDVSTAPGMTMDVFTPLGTLLNNNVTFAQVLNASIANISIANVSIANASIANSSLENSNLTLPHSNLTLVNISELIGLGQLIDSSILIADILNETLTIEIPINQSITLVQLLNESLTLALLLNETGNQTVSFEELVNVTITLEILISESSITLGQVIDKADTLWSSVSVDTGVLPYAGSLDYTFTRGIVSSVNL